MRRRTRTGLVIVALATLVGCSSDAASSSARPLSDEEAQRLAQVLVKDREAKGATFELTARLSDGTPLHLTGELDFTDHRGHAMVEATGVEAGVAEVFWDEQTVLERRPALTTQLAAAGRGTFEFVARPPDATGRDLDAMLGVLTGLAGTRPDNAVLLQQQETSKWLRRDAVRDIDVDVMQAGERTVYWIDATGVLQRFESNTPTGDRPFVVDLLSFGAQTIDGPAADAVVELADVRDLYEPLLAASSS